MVRIKPLDIALICSSLYSACKARPPKERLLICKPKSFYFKPQGIPAQELQEKVLKLEEFEAIKLYYCDNLSQVDAAFLMDISQSAIARILKSAREKIAHAIVEGKATRIEKEG